jgi:ribosomal protein S8
MKKLLLTVCTMLLAVSIIQAQATEEKKDVNQKFEKIQFVIKGEAKPDIYVDGKKFDFDLNLLDKDKIESISVIKDEQAIKEYNAPNGVVIIKTKKKTEISKVKTRAAETIIAGDKSPKVIIDGKVSDKETLDKLSPEDIEKISVVKDEQAMEKYNAPYGVIIITTKKGKKRKE